MTEQQVVRQIKRDYSDSGGRKRLAVAAGVSAGIITDIFKGRRKVSPNVLAALGLERIVTVHYRKVQGVGK